MTKQESYLQHIQKAAQQRLPLTMYAHQHGLAVQSLYAARYAAQKTKQRSNQPDTSAFVPVRLSENASVRIVLPNGVTLYTSEVTASLIQYLAALPCSA